MKKPPLLHLFSTVHIVSFLHFLRLRLTGKEFIVTGKCNQCGRCCRNINLKYHKGWIQSESQFHELLRQRPEYRRFFISPEQQAGGYLNFTCSWYNQRHGCSDYDNRLDICRKYPGKSLPVQGAKLLPGCGYRFDEGVPFRRHLVKEMKKYRQK